MKRLKRRIFSLIILIFTAFWFAFIIPFTVKIVQRQYFYPIKYTEIVVSESRRYSLSEYLVFAVINAESSFNKYAVSDKGAIGLMQLRSSTADFIASRLGEKEYDLYVESTNVKYGCYYLRYLLDKFSSEKSAICAYNAGEGNVKKWLLDERYSVDGVNLTAIPFAETEQYFLKIEKSRKKYEKLYANILDK